MALIFADKASENKLVRIAKMKFSIIDEAKLLPSEDQPGH